MFEPKTKVGVINIRGILRSAGPTVKNIKQMFENKNIKAVVFKVECPGGLSGTAQTIFQEINHYKKQHPDKYVVSLVENIAASGGYYVACATDYIIASPSAFIGSIGAYIQHPSFKAFIEQFHIKYEITKAGTYKGAGNPLLDLTPDQKAQFQDITNDTYRQFVRDVAKQRPQLPSDSTQWAEGKIFTGEQALGLTLIDKIGSPATVEEVLREKAQIVGDIEWIKPSKKRTFLSNLFAPEEDDDHSSYLASAVATICQTLESRYTNTAPLT